MEPDYKIGFENGDISPFAHVQAENVECEVEPEEVSLRHYKVKDYLNNHIWDDGGRLDRRVRRALVDIADDFWESCGVRWVRPSGVILTGSMCNYNWNEFSDIDLHIVVDFSKIHANKEFVQEYFDDKKNEWNDSHSGIEMYGFPVEVYVEDIGADRVSAGVYDLWTDKWIKTPEKGSVKPIMLNKYSIKKVSADIMTEIDELCDEIEGSDDKDVASEIGVKAEQLLDKIKGIRKIGLKDGEGGSGNIVYKVLRNLGYLDKLWKLSDKCYDTEMSVGGSKTFEESIRRAF